MTLQTLEAFGTLHREGNPVIVGLVTKLIPRVTTSLLLHLVLQHGIVFSFVTGFTVLIIYRFSFATVLKSLPASFTLGEAAIVTQGVIIFLYHCFLTLPFLDEVKATNEINIVLQIGLVGVAVIVASISLIPSFRKCITFYCLLTSVIVGVCIAPIGNKLAATILITFVFNDIERIAVVGVYIALLVLAGFIVSWQMRKNQKGSTRMRKTFHILIVLAFLPGLVYQCQFLYVATVVVFAIFIVLEVARVIKLFPFAEVLESAVTSFVDEKDAGKVALTPIYLLVGCSAPLWIHNSPCDLTGSSSFELLPLLSGILSIGIGDTFASIVGSKIGRHKWSSSNDKTVEGTIGGIVAQTCSLLLLYHLGYLPLTTRLMAVCGIAVITNSLVEALTDQVDNLVLPIITYIILALK